MPEDKSNPSYNPAVPGGNSAPGAIMEKLRDFVRREGARYLQDPNITSIGIGRKIGGGKDGQLCIQFTVGRKLTTNPEIESLGSKPIPTELNIGGDAIPTDVLERSYKPSFKVIAEPVPKPARKQRLDPIQPGASVGHLRVSAGTLGAIVYDTRDGYACMLSNWHVLNGPDGSLGDTVVQPGRFDDDRVDLNKAGTLVRSHLGAAGDCAIARIENRGYDPMVIDLQVKVGRIGEPELGDSVVKSGRTTNVTYGLVRRVDTVAKIDYGQGREETIGCFEIGPDSQHPAQEGQISMGGDSGSAWLAVDPNGQVTDVMVGLHFAGEGQGDPDDHALACYAKSVFNKLEITLNPPPADLAPSPADGSGISATADSAGGAGFNESFLSKKVPFPIVKQAVQNDVYRLHNSPHIPYTHYSVCLSKSRRMARFVAWNIDGANLKKYSRTGLSFQLDSRIPKEFQIGNEAYTDNKLDRGHVARRADLVWGPAAEARRGNRESFYYTNITPQHQRFNQSERGGLWGLLENAIYDDVEVDDLRVSVLGGPVLKESDREYRGIQVPSEFWKVIAFVETGKLKAKAFVLSQSDLLNDIEALDLDEFRLWQITLADLGARNSLDFGSLVQADTLALESVTRPELLGASGRVAREILSRDDLFLR
jgi:endonuclease G